MTTSTATASRPGQLGQFGFDPVARHRHVALPSGMVFVIGLSGVSAEKTGAAQARYNHASDAIAAALAAWNNHTGRADRSLAAAVRSAEDAPATLSRILEPELATRVEHFVRESEVLVPAAADALAAADLAAFGAVAAESQHLTETLLGNQVPETIALAATARELRAVAASAFGAGFGFGGSVWALVPRADADAFASDWLARHRAAFPHRVQADTLVTDAAAAAQRVQRPYLRG